MSAQLTDGPTKNSKLKTSPSFLMDKCTELVSLESPRACLQSALWAPLKYFSTSSFLFMNRFSRASGHFIIIPFGHMLHQKCVRLSQNICHLENPIASRGVKFQCDLWFRNGGGRRTILSITMLVCSWALLFWNITGFDFFLSRSWVQNTPTVKTSNRLLSL